MDGLEMDSALDQVSNFNLPATILDKLKTWTEQEIEQFTDQVRKQVSLHEEIEEAKDDVVNLRRACVAVLHDMDLDDDEKVKIIQTLHEAEQNESLFVKLAPTLMQLMDKSFYVIIILIMSFL